MEVAFSGYVFLDNVVELCLSTLKFREISPLNTERNTHSSVVAGDTLAVFGGRKPHELGGLEYLRSIEVIKPKYRYARWQRLLL